MMEQTTTGMNYDEKKERTLGAQAAGPQSLAVDIKEAASLLSVSTKTVRREIDKGKLIAVRIGRLLRVRTAELHAYLLRCQQRTSRGT